MEAGRGLTPPRPTLQPSWGLSSLCPSYLLSSSVLGSYNQFQGRPPPPAPQSTSQPQLPGCLFTGQLTPPGKVGAQSLCCLVGWWQEAKQGSLGAVATTSPGFQIEPNSLYVTKGQFYCSRLCSADLRTSRFGVPRLCCVAAIRDLMMGSGQFWPRL